MDHFYEDYIIERTYIGKPDSIWVQPGDQRVQIGMLTPKDAEARDLIIRWNSTDSMVFPIDHDVESQSVIIDNLEERDYVFNAYTIDRKGHRSLPMELSTTVAGPAYRTTITHRELDYSIIFRDSVALVWKAMSSETLFGVEIDFTDKAGVQQKTLVSSSTFASVVRDADPNESISVRTVFRAHPNAFEYFYTDPVEVDLVATKRNTLTLVSSAYTNAEYIDFHWVRVFLEADVPRPTGTDIDMCYTLGSGSRSNLFTMDGTGFGVFASAWQSAISFWPVRNVARLKLNRGTAAVELYNELDEMDRTQMVAAYENSAATGLNRVSGLLVDDVILLHSSDRDLYVAIKVVSVPPATAGVYGTLGIEFKISRP
ncbi:hypothetical protein GCM10011418_06730 [Sphingobacterium alkalisoli]|nr:hypothetical protein GCM10011418_06730 [Sphingobacterium alkalisoli]